ncbi:MAG: porin [Chitinophagaceae bacterium]
MKSYIIVVVSLMATTLYSQDSSKSVINISGYIEGYYSFDFANPVNHTKNNFSYNHRMHNQIGINLAYIKANYEDKNTRANLALMTGDYTRYNLANEPLILQNILEANVGIRLSKYKNIWLDIGVMPSHIGFESAISQDCWTLTRSLLAENSPYFETGAKLTFINKKKTLTTSFLLLNGWQTIERKDGFNKLNAGAQITYKPNAKLTLNYSNFIGSVYPDSVKNTRTYHNLYAIYEPNSKIGFTVGFDFGTESKGNWFSPVIIVRKSLSVNNKLTFRYEHFNDKKQLVIDANNLNGFVVSGASLNYDYMVNENCLFRIEAKNYFSNDNLFDANTKKANLCLTSGISLKF